MSRPGILVVEDEAIVARDIMRQVTDLGYNAVANTAYGEEAIELVGRLHPDLVLMDIQLAGALDGIQAAQQIREQFGTPIVFLTAFASPAVMQRAKSASPFGYLVKPFDPVQLCAAVEMALHQQEVETRLRQSREELATILRTAMDGFWVCDLTGRLLEVNEAACAILGYSRAEMLQLSVQDIEMLETPEQTRARIVKIQREGSDRFESRHRTRDGRVVDVEASLKFLPVTEGRIVCFFRDITERKRAEHEREATVRMLQLVNGQNDLHGLMREVSALLRDWSGCEAVGIRLREGDDFPYFETSGFPKRFIELERHLCQRDATGKPVRDAAGNPVLDCMCGNILCHRFDPTKPFFTAHGSFWCNCTTELLASTTEADRQARTRNRCNGEGYESVGLVPLRTGETTYGLLQFNDRRRDRFTPERITLLERLGDSLAVAIAQRQTQDALRASEARFRLLLESTTDYVVSVEHQADGLGHTRHSPGCLKVTGYSPDEFTRQPRLWLEMVPEEDRSTVEAYAKHITLGEQPPPLEHRITHRDGSIRWVRSSTVVRRSANSGDFVHEGVITDITARKQAELALRASEAKFATAFRAAPLTIALTSIENGTYLEVNEEFLRTTGFTREEVIGQTSAGLGTMTSADRARMLETLRRDGRINALPLTITVKGGQKLECLFSAEIVGIDGQPRLLSLALDVTATRRLESQLRQAQKMEAVGQLAGGVAHDFNNLLAAIALHLGLLREAPGIDPETRTALRDLEKETARGAGLTRQLLAFSRQQALDMKPVLLNEVLENLLKMLRRVLGERITVEWKAQPSLPTVEADVGMLEQIVVNLCVNARDAMPNGGRLLISTDTVTIDENYAKTNLSARPGRHVRLSISDTGSGMDSATLSRIFEPFFTTKEVGQGTGLGLAIVHGIVKQHNGWVEVESVVGTGTTFRVHLPATQHKVAAAPLLKADSLPRGHNELVLAIEDEESVRTVLSITLRRYGYRALLARNGAEAMELWQAHRAEIALVLTDMVLPGGMTGADLIARFRQERPELPMILASGYMKSKEGITIPGVTPLPKPFEMHTLLTALRTCLDTQPSS